MIPTHVHRRFWLLLVQNRVSMHPEGVLDFADSKAFTKESALVHRPNDVCFCQELVCDASSWFHCDAKGGVTVCCRGDRSQSVHFSEFPSWIRVVQV